MKNDIDLPGDDTGNVFFKTMSSNEKFKVNYGYFTGT